MRKTETNRNPDERMETRIGGKIEERRPAHHHTRIRLICRRTYKQGSRLQNTLLPAHSCLMVLIVKGFKQTTRGRDNQKETGRNYIYFDLIFVNSNTVDT